MKLAVKTLDNEAAGDIEIADAIFGVEVRPDILARTVNWQRAKRRAGTHKVKGRSEVAGSTKKLFRQKGTGHARAGSIKTPIRRGGGVAHGPTPRSYEQDLPKKVRRLALKMALSSRAAAGKLMVLEAAKVAEGKTKALAQRLEALGGRKSVIIDGGEVDQLFLRAARNLPDVLVLPALGANVFDILSKETLIVTREGIAALEARLS